MTRINKFRRELQTIYDRGVQMGDLVIVSNERFLRLIRMIDDEINAQLKHSGDDQETLKQIQAALQSVKKDDGLVNDDDAFPDDVEHDDATPNFNDDDLDDDNDDIDSYAGDDFDSDAPVDDDVDDVYDDEHDDGPTDPDSQAAEQHDEMEDATLNDGSATHLDEDASTSSDDAQTTDDDSSSDETEPDADDEGNASYDPFSQLDQQYTNKDTTHSSGNAGDTVKQLLEADANNDDDDEGDPLDVSMRNEPKNAPQSSNSQMPQGSSTQASTNPAPTPSSSSDRSSSDDGDNRWGNV